MKAQAGALAHWKVRIHVERERGQEKQSPAPGQAAPAHSWLLDVFNGDEVLQEGYDDTDPSLDLLLPPPTKQFASGIPIFCNFLKVGETAGRGDALNSMTNSLESPRQPQWLEAPNLFPALICGGRQGLSLSSTHCTRQQIQGYILLFWGFLIQQTKSILSNSDFNGIKFIWNEHQKWRNWKANVVLEHLVALNSSVLLVVCCWQDKGRKTPTFPLATCFLVLEARNEG